MGKFFAVVLVIIAIASAYPIVTHMYVQPEDISTHGHAIDEQLADTMAESGFAFLGAQFLLAFFIWKFSERNSGAKISHLPGGAKVMVAAAFILVGPEVLALGSRPRSRMPCRFKCKLDNSHFIFVTRARMESSALYTPTRSMRGTRTFSV